MSVPPADSNIYYTDHNGVRYIIDPAYSEGDIVLLADDYSGMVEDTTAFRTSKATLAEVS